MSKILNLDIGAGTMDVLYFDTEADNHYKAVVRSPVRTTAERVLAAPGNLLITGVEMGGGAVSQAIRRRAAERRVLITASAAMTLSHDPDRVRAMGVEVIEDAAATEHSEADGLTTIALGDLETERIRGIVKGFGVPFEFDAVGICVQDHGLAPPGVSSLDYRHNHYRALLDIEPTPAALLHAGDEIPDDMPRLRAVRDSAQVLPSDAVYLMDSGMAAVLGGTLDPRVRESRHAIILDIATSHTVAASFAGDDLCAFVEYHTKDIRVDDVALLLRDLADGRLEHEKVLAAGGHGAYTRCAVGFDSLDIILSTGPRRAMLTGCGLDLVPGAPFGDNMMTGAVGLLEAIRRREGWEELPSI
ncbi:MAG: DUF1786 family protein [Pseudomonadales bacterium]|jgi:uncharacterized protein (DUF1786 family)|nr:DUF1786 family protein [Pseudomonadales bacterium]MDP6472559.1 DUF1786 family protein [Pseudomonadales bacterium]MDP6829041.1 DUF1786 family protein [Pseudomonadales bacterium]MDP6971668.1 DUF1786 family protein [Pseudomonadales bacterium]